MIAQEVAFERDAEAGVERSLQKNLWIHDKNE